MIPTQYKVCVMGPAQVGKTRVLRKKIKYIYLYPFLYSYARSKCFLCSYPRMKKRYYKYS